MGNLNKWIDKNFTGNIKNKDILITGANSGIGFEAMRLAVCFGAHVIMAVRNLKRGEDARNLILNEFPDAKIDILQLNLSSFESIDKFTSKIINDNINIDVFYNNAGALKTNNKSSFLINYLSVYYLNEKLLNYFLSIKHEVKIIFTSSIAQYLHKIDFNHFLCRNCGDFKAYSIAKRCISNYFLYLSKKYINTNLIFLSSHPGICRTPLVNKSFNKFIYKLSILINLFVHKADKAALSFLYLLNDDIKTGTFIGPRGIFGISGYPKIKKIPNFIKEDMMKILRCSNRYIRLLKSKNSKYIKIYKRS